MILSINNYYAAQVRIVLVEGRFSIIANEETLLCAFASVIDSCKQIANQFQLVILSDVKQYHPAARTGSAVFVIHRIRTLCRIRVVKLLQRLRDAPCTYHYRTIRMPYTHNVWAVRARIYRSLRLRPRAVRISSGERQEVDGGVRLYFIPPDGKVRAIRVNRPFYGFTLADVTPPHPSPRKVIQLSRRVGPTPPRLPRTAPVAIRAQRCVTRALDVDAVSDDFSRSASAVICNLQQLVIG